MLQRCGNRNNKRYKDYGGRGIKVCSRWFAFENFFADMGHPPKGTTLGRIDNDGGYEPLNCRWETPKEQQNNMQTSVFLSAFGMKLTLSQWADCYGIDKKCLRARLTRGWSLEEALASPSKKEFRNHRKELGPKAKRTYQLTRTRDLLVCPTCLSRTSQVTPKPCYRICNECGTRFMLFHHRDAGRLTGRFEIRLVDDGIDKPNQF
jgi:hypothetical protein